MDREDSHQRISCLGGLHTSSRIDKTLYLYSSPVTKYRSTTATLANYEKERGQLSIQSSTPFKQLKYYIRVEVGGLIHGICLLRGLYMIEEPSSIYLHVIDK